MYGRDSLFRRLFRERFRSAARVALSFVRSWRLYFRLRPMAVGFEKGLLYVVVRKDRKDRRNPEADRRLSGMPFFTEGRPTVRERNGVSTENGVPGGGRRWNIKARPMDADGPVFCRRHGFRRLLPVPDVVPDVSVRNTSVECLRGNLIGRPNAGTCACYAFSACATVVFRPDFPFFVTS